MRNSKPQNPNPNKNSTLKTQRFGLGADLKWPGRNRDNEVVWFLKDEPQDGAARHPFDFEERTAKFGEAIVRFAKKIPGEAAKRLADFIAKLRNW
jgi:hypothetical protein